MKDKRREFRGVSEIRILTVRIWLLYGQLLQLYPVWADSLYSYPLPGCLSFNVLNCIIMVNIVTCRIKANVS